MAQDYIPAVVPTAGQVLSVVLQMSTFGVLCVCFTSRTSWIRNWRTLPLAIWLILIIYVDSTLFVLATSIIVHGLGINSSRGVCEGGILLCLICYMTTKIIIYYFLVERAYIVRGSRKPRIKTKLWLFNCLFMMLPYTIFVIMNFVWRITYINEKGVCIIGMQKIAMLPLIAFEVVVNVYLTLLFILPLRQLYSYKNAANPKLNRMAFRSLVGSLATLTTSVANLTVLMVLHGEPGWICLVCCNADILFCVLVLHWVTSKDKPSSYVSTHASRNGTDERSGGYTAPATRKSVAFATPEKTGSTVGHSKSEDEIVVLERQMTNVGTWPYELSPTSPTGAKLPGSVTTEIRGAQPMYPPPTVRSKSRNGLALLKTRDDNNSDCGDEVELHKIHVQREVCIDSGGSENGSDFGRKDMRCPSVEDTLGMKRSVSTEKMV